MRSRKKKKIIFKLIYNIFLAIILLGLLLFLLYIYSNREFVTSIKYLDNKIIVNLSEDNLYCILSDTVPNLNDKNWIKSNNNKCSLDYISNNLYVKNDNKIIYNNSKLMYLDINEKEKIYLPIGETYDYINILVGDFNKLEITNDNSDAVSIDSNGIIKSLKDGIANIKIKYFTEEYSIQVISTSLIVSAPKSYNNKKDYLKCNQYTSEENDLLDEILKYKIDNVGYKTRAATVEAARFLTLNLPYKVNYFYENGRQTTNNVDGEGRYYHVGLYLNSSRYSNITGTSTGPKTWGCSLYSNPAHRSITNGLDCSGFVSWALLNAGYDVKDVGAGFRTGKNNDLTDFGTLKTLTNSLARSDTIKVGDLLHSYAAGGHIAMIVGIDDDYYYVAQALWYDTIGVIITKYKKDKLASSFPHVVLMDKYYKEDGNLTDLWY